MTATEKKSTRSGGNRDGSETNTEEITPMSKTQGSARGVRDYVSLWAAIEGNTPGEMRWAVAGAIGEANSLARSTGAAEPNDAHDTTWCDLAVTAFERITGGVQ